MIKKILFTFLNFTLVSFQLCFAVSDEETPIAIKTEVILEGGTEYIPWEMPNYSNQEKALGYQMGVFSIPAGMEQRVSFWIDIYSKYTTHQGLLHDSRFVNLVYEDVDFSEIEKNEILTNHQKIRERRKLVDSAKAKIRERLRRLQKLNSPVGLEGEDLRYWYLFDKIEGSNKFLEAASEGRLRFQLGQKDRFSQGIKYSGKYIKEMEKIFEEEGLPKELTRLPFVESSFNLAARSRVGASGIWQFMRSTGRQYLRMDHFVDERNNPIIATRASARLLRFYYGILNSWPLAVTAYNHGANGIKRLVEKYNTSDLVELLDVRRGRFGFASANFYSCFLAALIVEQSATKYFDQPMWLKAESGSLLKLKSPLSYEGMLSLFDNNLDHAKDLNPHISERFWKSKGVLNKKVSIRIPSQIEEEKLLASFELTKKSIKEGRSVGVNEYKIETGDTLSGIAQQFRVSVKAILDLNSDLNPRRLRPGAILIIPQ